MGEDHCHQCFHVLPFWHLSLWLRKSSAVLSVSFLVSGYADYFCKATYGPSSYKIFSFIYFKIIVDNHIKHLLNTYSVRSACKLYICTIEVYKLGENIQNIYNNHFSHDFQIMVTGIWGSSSELVKKYKFLHRTTPLKVWNGAWDIRFLISFLGDSVTSHVWKVLIWFLPHRLFM